MKLSQTQINAIVSKIREEAHKVRNKRIDELKKDPKVNKEADKIFKQVQDIPLKIRKDIYALDIKRDRIVNILIDTSAAPTVRSASDIANDIILKSIDAEDLDSLLKAVSGIEK
jgi:hypothetical protein